MYPCTKMNFPGQWFCKSLYDKLTDRHTNTVYQGRIQGGGPPYFSQSQFYFLHCIQCLKIFLKLNFDFIVAEIQGIFGSVGVYACVCVSVWSDRSTRQISRFLSNMGGFRNRGRYCFLFSKGPILNDIRRHSDPQNIRQIAGDRIKFFKNSGGGPQTPRRRSRLRRSVRGFAPLPAPPFQNSWIRPWRQRRYAGS